MEPLDFLRLVLPSPGHGYYCACELNQRKEHVFVESIEDMLPHFDRWVKNGANAYFALATFGEERRLAGNAVAIKSLFIDMDGYDNPNSALAALDDFLNKTTLVELGSPCIVISGGGLHVYWPFTEEVDIDTWKPLAENFKRLCKQELLNIDNTVTADAARVLRPLGTKNFKPSYAKPRNVRIVAPGSGAFSFSALSELVLAKLHTPAYEHIPAQVIDLPGHRPAAAAASAVQMFANHTTKFRIIWAKSLNGDGCKQLEYYGEHAQEEGMEPLWRGLLSIAKTCDDGSKAAAKLSALHPYTPQRLRQKWDEIKGPYPCRKFDSENPGVCTTCQHWGKITNPLALGRDVETTAEAAEVTVPVATKSDVGAVTAVYKPPEPPRGYEYGKHGGVFKLGDEDEDGRVKKTQLLSYTLYVMEMLDTNEGHFIHLVALRKDGPRLFTIPAEVIASKDATLKALAKESVMAEFGGNDKGLYDYVRSCAGGMAGGSAQKVPHNYGWQEDNTFAHAGVVFRKDQEPLHVPMGGLQNIVASTQPKGSLDQWRGYIEMLIAKQMWQHLAVFLAGTAAPLMRYTDFAGMTVHCCSTSSGTGKSLSLNAVSSVWGNPKTFKIGKGTSPVAMHHHLGLLHSLPLVVDEVTENTRKDPEWFANFLLAMTEGKGKERMESGSNRERLNLSTWSSVAVMSSNTHAIDFLTTGRKHSAEGELLRLMEFKMDEVLHWTPAERTFMTTLEHNHGVAGYRFAQYLVDNEERLRPMVQEATLRVRKAFEMNDDERHWLALIGACAVASQLLKEAGLVALPLKEILEAFKKAVDMMRADIRGAKRTVEDVLWEYVQANYGQMIVVKKQADIPHLSDFRLNKEQDLSNTRTVIMGKIEIDVTPGWTDFYLPNTLLRKHCADRNFAYQDFVEQVSKLPNMQAVPNRRVDMLAGTKIGHSDMGRTYALKVSCRNEALPDAASSPLSMGAN